MDNKLLTPGLDNTRLFISLTAGAGTRCMSLLSSSPSLISFAVNEGLFAGAKNMKDAPGGYQRLVCFIVRISWITFHLPFDYT